MSNDWNQSFLPHDIPLVFRLTSLPLKPFESFHCGILQCSTFYFKATLQTVLTSYVFLEKMTHFQCFVPIVHHLLCSPKLWFTFGAFDQLLQITNQQSDCLE